ncbi:MAG: SPOR domain-containing protein [Candidatus Rokubacteria bacterium]|nr:SPOR domain-containing protein [Candidatus Rokubacteria bacterium]
MAPRPRRGGSGAGSFLLVIGCLAVLGATFTLGVMAGRHWPSFPFAGKEPVAKAARERDRDRSARAPEPTPTLTFYHELTAPLAAPPPAKPPKPARAEKAEPAKLDASKPEPVKPESQFTVQVGAYKAREPAETLRARLAAQGHDAYVVVADEPGGVRFRVRVGAFATREAAQVVAARIAGDRTLSAFVTAR